MCMEDVKIGREQQAAVKRMTASTTVTPYVAQSDTRAVLILVPPTVGNLTYSLEKPSAVGDGINFVPQSAPLALNIRDHGELVTREWFVLSDQASQIIQAVFSDLQRKE